LSAIYERQITGKGKFVKSALFETTAFLMGQHMAVSALTGVPVPPMPARVSAWSIYKTFESKDNQQVFVGIISEKHWERFCVAFEQNNWLADERLKTNNGRIDERDWFLPAVDELMKNYTKVEIIQKCEAADIPVAPIARPEDLFNDPQLNEGGSLFETIINENIHTKLPKIPLEIADSEIILKNNPPEIGENTKQILQDLGYENQEILDFLQENIIK
ncbi:MAG: CoA transferase, partial [Arcicella sp.]|nr:CoA transferase [Arcicella sp.]